MKYLWLTTLFFLPACAMEQYQTRDYYFQTKGIEAPFTAESFPHCQGYGCPQIEQVTLSDQDWQEIEALWSPLPATAAEERRQIAPTIGLFERKVGPLTGTEGDIKGTFKKLGRGQLDCVDESTNTTIYMSLLEDRGWLRFHDIEQPSIRLPFIGGGAWVHQTAVITERESGTQYAVDSWFDDNGADAHIVLLEDWTYGWKPEDAQQEEPKSGDESDNN